MTTKPFIEVYTGTTHLTEDYQPDVVPFVEIQEYVSAPFLIKVRLFVTLNNIKKLKPRSPIKIVLNYGQQPRYFHGYLDRIVKSDKRLFVGPLNKKEPALLEIKIEVRPGFWFARFNSNYTIHTTGKPETTEKIIQEVLKKYNTRIKILPKFYKLSGHKNQREYCVQYGESDFDFVLRLCQEEGWFFYFVHTQQQCEMVITDSDKSYKDLSHAPIDYRPGDTSAYLGISSFTSAQTFDIMDYTVVDYDYKQAAKTIEEQYHEKSPKPSVLYSFKRFLTVFGFDSGNKKKDKKTAKGMAKAYYQASDTQTQRVNATSNVPNIAPGCTYKYAFLKNIDNTSKKNIETLLGIKEKGMFVVSAVIHVYKFDPKAENTQPYTNKFILHKANTILRPKLTTPRPIIYGCQTATVLAPDGKELDDDKKGKLGRVKVQFHWEDKKQGKDYKTAAFIRVAQMIAGTHWGAQFTPRKGQEVVVTFEDGNPDRPLIIGSVYNSVNKPLLSEKQVDNFVNGINIGHGKTSTLAKKHNAIEFDDKPKKEKLSLHAQKDMEITLEAKGNQTTILKKGNQTTTLTEGNQTTTLKKGNQTTTIDQGDCTITVSKGTVTIKAKTIKFEATTEVDIKGPKVTINATDALSLKSKKVSIVSTGAGTFTSSGGLTLKSFSSATLNGGAGVEIKGPTTKIT